MRSYTERCVAQMFGLFSALEVLYTVLLRVMVDDVAVGRAIGWLEPDCASLLRAGDCCHVCW